MQTAGRKRWLLLETRSVGRGTGERYTEGGRVAVLHVVISRHEPQFSGVLVQIPVGREFAILKRNNACLYGIACVRKFEAGLHCRDNPARTAMTQKCRKQGKHSTKLDRFSLLFSGWAMIADAICATRKAFGSTRNTNKFQANKQRSGARDWTPAGNRMHVVWVHHARTSHGT